MTALSFLGDEGDGGPQGKVPAGHMGGHKRADGGGDRFGGGASGSHPNQVEGGFEAFGDPFS